MTRIKMHIFKVKLSFYLPCEVKCGLQKRVSTNVYLPPVSQVPYRVRGKSSARRPISSERMLLSHVSYGRANSNNEH